MFQDLSTDSLEEVTDFSGFTTLTSNLYEARLTSAYGGYSAKGAAFVRLSFDLDGKEYNEVIYVSTREGKNYYTKNGKNYGLPGFNIINAICAMVTGEELAQQDTEIKKVKAWDPELKKETIQDVPMLVDLIDGVVTLGILEEVEDKYNGEPGETIRKNSIDAVFHSESRQTYAEACRDDEAKFIDTWLKSNEEKVRDKSGKSSNKTTSKGSGGSDKPARTKSVFGKK